MQPIKTLRKAIQPMHGALEATEPMQTLMLPGLTPYQYNHLLGWWYQTWMRLETLEQSLRPDDSLAIIAPVARAYKARHDYEHLSALQNLPLCETATTLPDGPELPAGESSWLSLVYIMRGSELGNQIVYQHLKTCFSNTKTVAYLSFFEPTEAPLAWPAVLKILNSRMEAQGHTTSVITAARKVFQWLHESAVISKTCETHPDRGR